MQNALSANPQLLVDDHGRSQSDTRVPGVGVPAILGRGRVLDALKLGNNPAVTQWPPVVLMLRDPTDGSIVGTPGLHISRLLVATRTNRTFRER